jgi:hypothetical protein
VAKLTAVSRVIEHASDQLDALPPVVHDNALEFKMRAAVIKDLSCYMENKLAMLNPESSMNS